MGFVERLRLGSRVCHFIHPALDARNACVEGVEVVKETVINSDPNRYRQHRVHRTHEANDFRLSNLRTGEETHLTGASPVRDGDGRAVGSPSTSDRAALSDDGPVGPHANAALDDAADLFHKERVRALGSGDGGSAPRAQVDASLRGNC